MAFRRDADHEADRALKKLLKGLSGDQTVSVIRAFTYFSHLANLAEDRHHIRRRAIHERAGNTQEGSIDVALQRLRWAGITPRTIASTLAHSYVSPVLTAHPTEVQRKSILDAERDIAKLLTERDEIRARAAAAAVSAAKDALTPRELAANEAQLRARVMQLWQTRLLRFTKLTVADEIENALSYYESTFLREIPKLYAELERELGGQPVAQLPAHGPVDRRRPRRQPQRDRRNPGLRAAPPGRCGAAPLPDRGALPGRRAVAVGHADRRVARRCRRWPNARPTPTSTARTNPTAAR